MDVDCKPNSSLSPLPQERDLIYSSPSFSILTSSDTFLVVHVPAARWFTTNEKGASFLQTLFVRWNDSVRCTQMEKDFLDRVRMTGFFRGAHASPDVFIPQTIVLSITERCNLECLYCLSSSSFRYKKYAKHWNAVPFVRLRHFLSQIRDLNRECRIYISGGEPFLNPHLPQIIRELKSFDFFVGIVTNLTVQPTDKFSRKDNTLPDEIRVSLDSMDESINNQTRPSSYRRVMAHLDALDSLNLQIVLSVTVSTENLHFLDPVFEFARTRHYGVNLSYLLPVGRAQTHPRLVPDYSTLDTRFFSKYSEACIDTDQQGRRSSTCGLAGSSLYVDLSGNVYACNMLAGSPFFLGNAFDDNIRDLVRDFKAVRDLSSVDNIRGCSSCCLRFICGGSCRACSYYEHHCLNERTVDCYIKYAETLAGMCNSGPDILLV